MIKILAVLLLLVSSVAMAQNNTYIVPSITFLLFEGECLISGKGINCIAGGRIRVPLTDVTIDCDSSSSGSETYIKYLVSGNLVELFVGLNELPKLTVRLNWTWEPYSGFLTHFESWYPGGTLTAGLVRPSACEIPPISYINNFSVAGNEWKVIPVFSSTPTTITVEALILERQ